MGDDFTNKHGQVNEIKLAYWLWKKMGVNYIKLTRVHKNRILAMYKLNGLDAMKEFVLPIATKKQLFEGKYGKDK